VYQIFINLSDRRDMTDHSNIEEEVNPDSPPAKSNNDSQIELDKPVFWPSLISLVVISSILLIKPKASLTILKGMLHFCTHNLGSIFLLFGFFGSLWLIWLVLSRYGDQPLGPEGEPPAYSTISWFGMLFCAGIGSNLLYFGTIEWMWYYLGPPAGIVAQTPEAYAWAGAYSFFHWGPIAWAIYAIAAVPLAYMLHVKGTSVLRLSEACRDVLGDRVDGVLGRGIDVLFIFGLVGGVGTSLGVGIPMISAVASEIFGVERGMTLDMVILIGLTITFSISVSLGLDKGIKVLSDVNVVLAIVLLAFIFAVGDSAFIVNQALDSLSLVLQNIVRMSLRTEAALKSTFAQDFTVFYWAWWIAWAPFMGLFIARISRGRTIRNVVIGIVFGGCLGCGAGFAILGNSSMSMIINENPEMIKLLQDAATASSPTALDGPSVVVALLKSLPLSNFIFIIFFVLAFIFVATSLDSAAFTLSATASKNLPVDGQPPRWHRLVWAFVLGFVALSLMYIGGIEILQTASVVVGVPLLVVMIIAVISFMKAIQEKENEKENK
jgi:betaine/carnitine transporter, BCCT family